MTTYEDWRITTHAREAAARRGFSLVDVLRAATDPEVAYDQPRFGEGCAMHQRGAIAVGVNRNTRVILNVLHRKVAQWVDA